MVKSKKEIVIEIKKRIRERDIRIKSILKRGNKNLELQELRSQQIMDRRRIISII